MCVGVQGGNSGTSSAFAGPNTMLNPEAIGGNVNIGNVGGGTINQAPSTVVHGNGMKQTSSLSLPGMGGGGGGDDAGKEGGEDAAGDAGEMGDLADMGELAAF